MKENSLFYMTDNKPLATRMRPRSTKDIVGQDHILGENKILNRMVRSKQVSSIILYGPPGVGKTSIARALANDFNISINKYNASVDSKKDLQNILKNATPVNKTILLIDEIHRLTKPNQDLLLKYIEDGSVILVGATTENPYMSIVPALRSRSSIFELYKVDKESIVKVLYKAINDKEQGLNNYKIKVDKETLYSLANKANGDVRVALNTLELATLSTEANSDNEVVINNEIINSCIQSKQLGGDKGEDTHYNLLSALQKSIRGSDVDASLHYLARLIESGDLISILRRLLVISYEDIGLADNNIHNETLNAIKTAERVGLPEARIPLSYIVIRLTLSRKSNVAYRAITKAINELDSHKDLSIPKTIHDNHYKGASKLGKGLGYKYPHDYSHGLISQQYLPDDFKDDRYLEFRDETDTEEVRKIYEKINKVIKD